MAKEKSFEESIDRLEKILEQMNSGEIGLEESLKLFEEADKLILSSHKRLTDAEKKVETLIKKRSGELELSSTGEPLKEEFGE